MKFIKVKEDCYLNIDSIEFIEVEKRRVYTIGSQEYYTLTKEEMNILLDEINKK